MTGEYSQPQQPEPFDLVAAPSPMIAHDMAETARAMRGDLHRASATYWLTGGSVGELVRRACSRDNGDPTPRRAAGGVTAAVFRETMLRGEVDEDSLRALQNYLNRTTEQ